MTTELATQSLSDFAITKFRPEEIGELLAENLGGAKIDIFNLTRIHVPSGGGEHLTVGDGEPTKDVDGIILAYRHVRQFWEKGMDEGGSMPPDCTSSDLEHGHGNPGGLCDECPNSDWGSGKKGRGQACQLRVNVLFLRKDSVIPNHISVPVTGCKDFTRYMLSCTEKGIIGSRALTRLSLKPATNPDGIKYAEFVWTCLGPIADEDIERIKAAASAMKEAIAQ